MSVFKDKSLDEIIKKYSNNLDEYDDNDDELDDYDDIGEYEDYEYDEYDEDIEELEEVDDDSEEEKLSRKKWSLSKKVQLIIASVCTLGIIIGIPIYAWFSHLRQVGELQQIREPDLLYITAANAEDVKFFDLSSIKVKNSDGTPVTTPEYYPFGVAGKYVNTFTLQMAHTTNNPFIYKIYEGTAYATEEAARAAAGPSGVVVEYKLNGEWETLSQNGVILSGDPKPIEKSATQTTIYIVKGAELDSNKYGGGRYLNSQVIDGRLVANSTYHEQCYGAYNDLITYEEPLYWQCSGIPSLNSGSIYVGQPFMKTFILEISWTAADVNDHKIDNDKETDIVYLSAFRR